MAQRITNSHLEHLVDRINAITNQAPIPYSKDNNGKHKANIGNYHLSAAYGGVMLAQICNDGGGIDTPLGSYHRPKRELYEQMQAFISGLSVNEKV